MSEAHVKEAQRLLGVKADGDFGPASLAALKLRLGAEKTDPNASEVPPVLTQDAPLSVRALHWCLQEAARWGKSQVSQQTRADYFTGCVRGGLAGHGSWLRGEVLKGTHYSFCAAAQGFAEDRASRKTDAMPPWRSGALEVMRDADAGLRPGQRWLSIAEMSTRRLLPHPGALAVYQNTTSPTNGHVERVVEATATGYRSVGANEQDKRWVVDAKPIAYADASKADGTQRLKLLGFVVDTATVP